MRALMRRVLSAGAAVLLVLPWAAPASAQAVTTNPGAPPGFVAPAEPKAEEDNAARAKTQPGNNAPMWRAVRNTGAQAGTTQVQGVEAGVLVQSFTQYPGSAFATAGEAWRQSRNGWILRYGGALVLLAALAVGLYHWRTGGIGGHERNTGRLIERFTYFERAAHWAVAISFVILAVSGLVMALGRFVLLPILGATLFGWLAYLLKTLHNFAGPVFAVALVVFAIGYVRDNLPRAGDLAWLSRAGGMLSGDLLPSGRFNAGEKVVFWGGVIVLGATVVASGLVLDKLAGSLLEYTRGQMQVAHIVHAVASFLMMALFVGHIYMGTVGVKGSFQAMRTGYVDEAWAREHHGLWHDDIQAGRVPAIRSGRAAPPAHTSGVPG